MADEVLTISPLIWQSRKERIHMSFFTGLLLPLLRDSIIGKILNCAIEWVSKCVFKDKDSSRCRKYEHCKSYEDLLTSAISDIADITKTDYNQIVLCVNTGSHGLSLLVCADKIAKGKQKYRVVANGGLIARSFHTGKYIRMAKIGENSHYFVAVEETKSELVVPIQMDDNKVGVINSEATEKYYYTNKMLKELQEVSKSICLRLVEMNFSGDSQEIPYISL